MESLSRMFIERLFLAFFDWLDTNRKAIGDKWYRGLWSRGKEAEADCNTISKLIGDGMWMLNQVSNLGVMAGVSPNRVDLQVLAPSLDRQSTMRLLALISSSLGLQGLPKEIREQEIPVITSKHFSLRLYTQQRGL
jgi:hypothetical protein